MREPKTQYVDDLAAASDDYLRDRLEEASQYAATIRHRQSRNEWWDERIRVKAEIERRAGLPTGVEHG